MEILLDVVRTMPCLWAAWAELASILASTSSTANELSPILSKVPEHPISTLFKIHLATEYFFFPGQQALIHSWLDALDPIFPDSNVLRGFRAMTFYESRDFESAEQHYTSLLSDPYSLDHFDGFANVLFVMGKRAKLGYLAQTAATIDPYRKESQIAIGNYYSLRGNHTSAINAFRLALQLDRNYLAAWTLIGHEFVELKNTQAAIDAYRRAVDVNPRDFRAWYGLGQAYEVLKMPGYAAYYYQRAAGVK